MINALPSRPAQTDEATEPKADLLTYLNGAGEIIKSAISDFYWLASLMELAAGNQHENNALSLSTAAIIFGGLGAACTATGATYSHWQLNVNHQTPKGPNVDTEANTGQSLHLMQKTLYYSTLFHTLATLQALLRLLLTYSRKETFPRQRKPAFMGSPHCLALSRHTLK